MRLYTLTGIGPKLPTPYRRTALSATDAIRQKSAMLADICQDVVAEDISGCLVDWPTMGGLSMREAAVDTGRSGDEHYLASTAD